MGFCLYQIIIARFTAGSNEVFHFFRWGIWDEDVNWYIDLLCDIGFLGISTVNEFRYSREEGERSMLREISTRLAAQTGTTETFKINPAFYQVLQIE